MDIGSLIVMFVFLPFFLVIPIWALVDMAQRPDHAWRTTNRNKTAWLLGLILGWLLGFGIVGAIVAIVYLVGPRKDLERAATRPVAPEPGWYDNPEGGGQRYWDGSTWTNDFKSSQGTGDESTRRPAFGSRSVRARLDELDELRQEGRISDGEYQRQRERLLDEL